ncbi:hypothetical protein [Staphylococcus phage vB_SauM-V1SA22]|nr:hypothetical protein [Staphylococcus phage vB_SauM-V1SA22]
MSLVINAFISPYTIQLIFSDFSTFTLTFSSYVVV